MSRKIVGGGKGGLGVGAWQMARACAQVQRGEAMGSGTGLDSSVAPLSFLAVRVSSSGIHCPCVTPVVLWTLLLQKLHLSEDVAGATFMAAGSSTPELFASVIGKKCPARLEHGSSGRALA
jgi:hypothetical protein